MIYNKWIDCTEDNYWQTEEDICFVPAIDGDDREYSFFGTRRECPYGWNVLVRREAKFMSVELPIITKKEDECD